MSAFNQDSGAKLLAALKRGIENITLNVLNENPRDYHKRGRVIRQDEWGWILSIDNATYTRIPSLERVADYKQGDVVEVMIPNGQPSNMFIMGRLGGVVSSGGDDSVTKEYLNNELLKYVTKTDFTLALANYVTTANLNDILSGYVTDAKLATQLANYVTTTALNNVLAGYVTIANLDDTLANYVTTGTTQTVSGLKTFTAANKFTAETVFSNSSYAPTWADIASGVGKSSCFTRGALMQAFIGQIIAPNSYQPTTGAYNYEVNKIKFQKITATSNGQPTLEEMAVISDTGMTVGGETVATNATVKGIFSLDTTTSTLTITTTNL